MLLNSLSFLLFVTRTCLLYIALLTRYRWDLMLTNGLSSYDFKAVVYSLAVDRGNLKLQKQLGGYNLYVSYFLHLVGGPIEKASNLLTHFLQKFNLEYNRMVQYLKLQLWGFIMNLVVADRLSIN